MNLLFNPRGMSFDFTVGDWEPCEGVQKLGGFAVGLAFHRVPYFPYWHHSNSIRLGYNRDTKTSPVRLFLYAYVAGKLIDPKECVLGLFNVGSKLEAHLYWNLSLCGIEIYKQRGYRFPTHDVYKQRFNKTLPIGYKLHPYAEEDRTQKRLDFNVELTNVKYW